VQFKQNVIAEYVFWIHVQGGESPPVPTEYNFGRSPRIKILVGCNSKKWLPIINENKKE
jgi:hypothetical protein